jgi:hypothetical protein
VVARCVGYSCKARGSLLFVTGIDRPQPIKRTPGQNPVSEHLSVSCSHSDFVLEPAEYPPNDDRLSCSHSDFVLEPAEYPPNDDRLSCSHSDFVSNILQMMTGLEEGKLGHHQPEDKGPLKVLKTVG